MADRRWLVATAAAVSGFLALLAGSLAIATGADWGDLFESFAFTNTVIGLSFAVTGALIAWFRPANWVGWLFVASGLGHLVSAAGAMLAFAGLQWGWAPWLIATATTLYATLWQAGILALFPLALIVFPTGRLLSPRWMIVVVFIAVHAVWMLAVAAFASETLFGRAEATSILSIGLVLPEPLEIAGNLLSSVTLVAAAVALVVRYARGDDVVRRQLLWLILALIAIGLLNSQRWLTGDGPVLPLLSVALIPVAVAIAILRYRLLDIRLVLSRTLLYALVFGLVIAAYVGLVAGLSLLVPTEVERGISIAAAVAVALAFNPLRLLLQGVIDRAFYGSRRDPTLLVTRLSDQLRRPDDDLSFLLDRVRHDLRLPYLALRDTEAALIAESGDGSETTLAEMPLVYQALPQGALVVGLRRGDSSMHPADERTLGLVAGPLALALYALRLAAEVALARAATVEAREHERAILYRELHDGLGPELTSAAFRADAAYNLVRSDPDQTAALLGELRAEIRSSLNDVRRVVYGLRPIELDKRGLVGAIRNRMDALAPDIQGTLSAPATLPELSPAVELAAYRIVSEALTNVLRHSSGTTVVVEVSVDAELHVVVVDDGAPAEGWAEGVGIGSMIERAEELGGSASVGPHEGGWRVEAHLPRALPSAASANQEGSAR